MKDDVLRRCLLAGFAGVAFLTFAGFSGPANAQRKKYVAFGWEFENATPSNILQVVDSLDCTPLDGIGLCPRLRDRHGRMMSSKLMDMPPLDWSDIEPWVPVLRELSSHRSMHESFMKSICAPTNRLDWTDDAAWSRVTETMRLLARFAREGGLRGLWVDDEDYHRQRQYYWRAGDPQYDRLCGIARRRGQEVFSAIFAEYPDATVFFFRFLSRVHAYFNYDDLHSACRARGDLWPSFINGMLDVLPPSARIVDGYEYGYRFSAENGKGDYYFGHALQKSRFANLASATNRSKYRAQVLSAPAIYMDKYINPETSRWYAPPLNGSRPARFSADVAQATHVADEYVWLWGEKSCWSNWRGKMPPRKYMSFETWEERLPGIQDAMSFRKCPRDFAVERLALLKRTGKFSPLNANVECALANGSTSDSLAKPYSGWSAVEGDKEGRFAFDSSVGENDTSSLVAEGVASGCFVMSSGLVRPGEKYLVGFSAKGDIVGGGVEWKRDGKWDFSIPGVSVPMSAPDANGWRHGLVAIQIPENANGFGLQLRVMQAPGERSWFDNVFYCRADLATGGDSE